MFNGAGQGIQRKAKTLTTISVVFSIITGIAIIILIAMIDADPDLVVTFAIMGAVIVGIEIWFATLWGAILYGYGVMVDRMEFWLPSGYAESRQAAEQAYKQYLEEQTRKMENPQPIIIERRGQTNGPVINDQPVVQNHGTNEEQNTGRWYCRSCGSSNSNQSRFCQACGEQKI